MSYRKMVIPLILVLLILYTVNVQCQEDTILVVTDEVVVTDGSFKIGSPREVFSIGEDGVYFYIELKNIEKALLLNIKILNPIGEKVLDYEMNISSPREKGILRYPWVRGYLYIPIMSKERGFAFFRIYYYEKISGELPEDARIDMDGEWNFQIYQNGKLVKSLSFIIRLLRLKVYILSSNGAIIDEAKARIMGDHETSIIDVSGGILELNLRPGSYLLEVYKSNFIVYKSIINMTREDMEIQAVCNVTDLTIRVLDGKGVPLEKANVILAGLDSIQEALTNESGYVVFKQLPFHKYRISIAKYGVNIGEYELLVNNPIAVYDLTANVTDFCVKIIGEHGKPLVGGKITLVFPEVMLTALTNENGKAEFEQVPSGNWDLIIEYKNLQEKDKVFLGERECAEVRLPVFSEFFGISLSKEMTLTIIFGLVTIVILAIAAAVLRGRIKE